MSRTSLPLSLALLLAGCCVVAPARSARAASLGSMVQAYCLAAFHEEMAQAGKVPPEGMATYACRCMVDRLTEGTSLPSARSFCRESTARRFAL